MDNKTCKKCGHLCHCIEADHDGCKCTGCDCEQSKAQDLTYEYCGAENGGHWGDG
mgnify:CR=1 FL=1